jgi:RND family efflux transporter MFP subunit
MKIPYWIKAKRFWIPTVVVLIVAISSLARQGSVGQDGEVQGQQVKVVDVLEVKPRSEVTTEITLKGTVVPQEFIRLKSLTTANLEYLRPVGDHVVAGEQVVVMSDSRIMESYTNALQTVSEAQGNLSQYRALNSEAITQAELNQQSAAASLELARENVNSQIKLNTGDLDATVAQAEISYAASFNLAEEVLRYWSTGTLVEFRLEHINSAHIALQSQVTDAFTAAKSVFLSASLKPQTDLNAALTDISSVLQTIRDFNDLVFRLLSFALPGSGLTEGSITALSGQASTFTGRLNSQLSSIAAAKNSLAKAEISVGVQELAARNQLRQAEIQFDNVTSALTSSRRQAEIRELGAQSQLTTARTQLAAAQSQYNELFVKAPFAGVVIAHLADRGDQITPGQNLLELGDVSGVEIELALDQSSASRIRLGDEVLINDKVTGTIVELNPIASLETGKVGLKVAADGVGLEPGAVADVKLNLVYYTSNVIVIPLNSVTITQNRAFVLIAENSLVTEHSVTLGQVFDSQIEVTSGLNTGDLVILNNGEFLSRGEEIEVNIAE